MNRLNRRQFLAVLSATPLAMTLPAHNSLAAECNTQHPLMPPNGQYQGQCPVCGMVRSMWARTWITFDQDQNVSQVCSFHCLADWTLKSGKEPKNVQLAVYHHPEKIIPAKEAFVVIGSSAAGTMSPVSKLVFQDGKDAKSFAKNCGGKVIDYAEALQAAKESATKENKMIHARRVKKGKIVEPSEKDHCPVCNMVPARYPYGKCQIKAKGGQTIHFCSTQCLFAFLGKQDLYGKEPVDPFLIWVVDRNSGMWISAKSAFYVTGSKKVFGPMGYEAFPFNSLKEAEEFTISNGGKTSIYDDITIERIVPGWSYR